MRIISVKVNDKLDTSLIVQTICFMMKHFTRKELRDIANGYGVKRGRNKIDTIHNLITEGKVKTIYATRN